MLRGCGLCNCLIVWIVISIVLVLMNMVWVRLVRVLVLLWL